MNLEQYCQSKGIMLKQPVVHAEISEEIYVPIEICEPILKKWDIENVESFFANMELPNETIKLNAWTTIIDIPKFIESHLEVAKAHNGIPVYKPYFERLLKLKEIFQQEIK